MSTKDDSSDTISWRVPWQVGNPNWCVRSNRLSLIGCRIQVVDWVSLTDCPRPTVIQKLSTPEILYRLSSNRLSSTGCHVQTAVYKLSCINRRVQAVVYRLSSTGYHETGHRVQTAMYRLSDTGYQVQTIMYRLW